MYWTDICFNRQLSDQEIAQGFSTVFDLSPDKVAVVKKQTFEEWENVPSDARIVCAYLNVEDTGDFPIGLSIMIRDSHLMPASEDDLIVIGDLCEAMHCEALISADDDDAYAFWLVEGQDRYERVLLDADRLDNNSEFVIARKAVMG